MAAGGLGRVQDSQTPSSPEHEVCTVHFSPRRWRDWRGPATGVGGGESLTSMTESALSTNLSVFLPSNEMVGQGWISVYLSYPWHLRDCSSNAATVEPGGVVLRGASPANRASQPSRGLDDRFLTRSQGQASPAARAQGCQGGRGRSDLRAPSSRDVRATIF